MGRKNKAYLDCPERGDAQLRLWERLNASGYFDNPPVETVRVEESLGRVTAGCVYANQSVPHYNGAAMDGIAVYSPDTFGAQDTAPKKLTLLSAGQAFIPSGCYIVDTGDVMPAGTNAVIMIEDVQLDGTAAEIVAAATPWQHVRIIGEDIVKGEMVLPEHQVIAPVDVAALLAAGIEQVEVVKRPSVAIIPTGTEIVATVQELKPGAILDVNSHMLAAAVAQWGGKPNRMSIVPDDYHKLKQAVWAALASNDMVITNAGTSAGTEDFTSAVLADLGEVIVHGVAIKPGKPVVLAICQGKPVVGLPGYPVSAMLTAEMFVRDILAARQQLPKPEPAKVKAVLARQVASSIGVEEYVRVSIGNVQGKTVVTGLSRGAGVISSLTKAQGVITIDSASAGLPAGAEVDATLLRSGRPENTVLAVGSHDLALELMGVYMKRRLRSASLSCANVGSMGGVLAIRNNEAHIAGVHMLDEETGQYNIDYMTKFLPGVNWRLVHFAMREQGLMVRAGNPKGINGLKDLARPDVTFVNRQRGSGTRMLLDYSLTKLAITPQLITGYEKEVGTHMAVAATVAGGTADAGLGIRAAAEALGLDFVPVAKEQYDLILNFAPDDERDELIIDILKSPDFRCEVEGFGGYDMSRSGEELAARSG